MDMRGYGKGAIALGVVAALAYVSTLFEDKPSGDPAPQPAAEVSPAAPAADEAPGCIAQGVDPAPPVFASAPDPRGISTRHVFDRLVEYDRRSGRIVPGLATKWEVSDDRRTYTFHLRHGVSFHSVPGFTPTRAFSADDVLFTFRRLWIPGNPYRHTPDVGLDDFAKVGMPDLLVQVNRADTDIVVFDLTVPYPKFLANLSMDFASIQSAEYAEAMTKAGTPERFASQPIGTGPFAVKEIGKDGVVYAANPAYWADHLPAAETRAVPKQIVPPSIYGID